MKNLLNSLRKNLNNHSAQNEKAAFKDSKQLFFAKTAAQKMFPALLRTAHEYFHDEAS